MGVLFDYFVAASDDDAAQTINWPSGPQGGPPKCGVFNKRQEGYETVTDTGIDPQVALSVFEELLTGRSFDDQLADPEARPIVAERDNGERLVVRLGAQLADALAASDHAPIRSLAQPWSEIEEFHGEFTPRMSRPSWNFGGGPRCDQAAITGSF